MAKKKSKPPGKSPKRKAPAKSKAEPLPELPDRRALEGLMQNLLGGVLGEPDDSPLSKAQEIVYQAFDTPDPVKRIKLAKKALATSPDCADAYVLLAEDAATRKEALAFYEEAVAAGERALGSETFGEDVGHFWGLIETRPYMPRKEGLAHLLWTAGRRDEAIDHLKDMLRLNPGDNQGVRYTLSSWLVAEGRDAELSDLLSAYDEDSAAWLYTATLLAFRQHGDTPDARKKLKAATKANRHVPAYLLGDAMMPRDQPFSYTMGSEDEAILYAAEALSGWKSTPGAITWLKSAIPASKKKPAKAKAKAKTEGPKALVKKRLEKIPREFDVWQADFRQLGSRVEEEGQLYDPWLIVVSSRTNGLILAQAMSAEPPTSEFLWDTLVSAIREPMMEGPHRPTEVQVRKDERWDALAPHLEEIGIATTPVGELDHIDFLFAELQKGLTASQPPGLLEMPGVKPEQLAGFYAAAASFYRKAPWRKLGFEAAIKVECPKFDSGPWYAIVMGQSGMTMGVALYDDYAILKKLWTGEMSDEENARETVALTMTFDEEAEISDADLGAIDQYDFEIAGPEAYPTIFRKERGLSMRPPLAWEIELMEGCLRALPDFVAARKPDDMTKFEASAEVSTGTLPLTLSWAAE